MGSKCESEDYPQQSQDSGACTHRAEHSRPAPGPSLDHEWRLSRRRGDLGSCTFSFPSQTGIRCARRRRQSAREAADGRRRGSVPGDVRGDETLRKVVAFLHRGGPPARSFLAAIILAPHAWAVGPTAAWILDFLTEVVVHKHNRTISLVVKERIIIIERERFSKAYWPTFEGNMIIHPVMMQGHTYTCVGELMIQTWMAVMQKAK